MNSSLQSLLGLGDFVRGFSCQKWLWSSVPSARLLRRFMAVRDAHTSLDYQRKSRLLHSFKEVLSVQVPEFRDQQQKDAHEFLTSVLDQMRNLAPLLQDCADIMSRTYTCPVEGHLVFNMENTRTCKRCGIQSKQLETFTNLSLDLVPGGSVVQMIQRYQMSLFSLC
ncbi:ubiquitin carboxyl-terminal hydrolase 37-like [Anabas testudineus]|uniref:ubiquitin carboxyl-terminal hydrolase 37-like n=1 Tax=Anabas testudineus TaxID=64144 RepID=UPI00143D11C6|nr:ubiquitin carboxyl-terminal hydrolase 37-like [Anabas testudineus]